MSLPHVGRGVTREQQEELQEELEEELEEVEVELEEGKALRNNQLPF